MTIDVGQGLMNAGLFLGIPMVLLVFVAQWYWARICDRNVQLLIAQQNGDGVYKLAPKEGGQVTITNPMTQEIRVWPINALSTITVPYPGLGFIPKFLQKSIQQVWLNEGDWEPVLNRSPHHRRVASPDVVDFIRDLVSVDTKLFKELPEKAQRYLVDLNNKSEAFLDGIATGPTREMVADPAALGNLMRSSVLKALATVGDDLMEMFKGLRTQLARLTGLNPTYVYILLLLCAALAGFAVFKIMAIAKALGL